MGVFLGNPKDSVWEDWGSPNRETLAASPPGTFKNPIIKKNGLAELPEISGMKHRC